MPRILSLVLLATLFLPSCIPYSHRIRFPNGIENRVPEGVTAGSVEALAIPVWRVDEDFLVLHAALVPSDDLGELPNRIPEHWNTGLMDLQGHGSDRNRFLRCLYLVFDTGRVLWTEYDTWEITDTRFGNKKFHQRWMNFHVGTIGPEWRAELLESLGGNESVRIHDVMLDPGQFWFVEAASPEKVETVRRNLDFPELDAERMRGFARSVTIRFSLTGSAQKFVTEFVSRIPESASSSDTWAHRPPASSP